MSTAKNHAIRSHRSHKDHYVASGIVRRSSEARSKGLFPMLHRQSGRPREAK